jgi:hypothetical protein
MQDAHQKLQLGQSVMAEVQDDAHYVWCGAILHKPMYH